MNMNKWNIDEFVEVLNKEIPLNNFSNDSLDKRRSTEWTKRMVRTYFSTAELTPALKDGKQRYYNENHLEEFRKLIELQYSGVPYKTATSVLKSSYGNSGIEFNASGSILRESSGIRGLNTNNFIGANSGSFQDKKESALELLKNIAHSSQSQNSGMGNKNQMWMKYTIKEGVEINIREDSLKDRSFINDIKKWLNEQ